MSSSAPPKRPPSADPSFDLDYSIEEFELDPHRDSQFLFRHVDEAMLQEGLVRGGRTLDVACGSGRLAARICERGGEGWGVEPSQEMLGISRLVFPASRVVLVRSVAEVLPFRDASFDRVLCQGAVDHFVDPHAFVREAARVLRPGGRLIVAVANYESLSCRLGRLLCRVAPAPFRRSSSAKRPYWEPPPDHHHKGEPAFVRRLGGERLRLERCYGVSLLWLLEGWGEWRWGHWLDGLPDSLAQTFLVMLDRIARRVPTMADVLVSVWRPREQ